MQHHYSQVNTVSCYRCDEYDGAALQPLLLQLLGDMGVEPSALAGKKVVIKPNLLAAADADKAMTTHPALLRALALILTEAGAYVTVAESSGGPYTEVALRTIYAACGITDAVKDTGAALNFDTTHGTLSASDGRYSTRFSIITPILEADVIFNLCKLKTHSLATMTAAAKNLFGTVPGLQKFELHARYRDQKHFLGALCDLCDCLCTEKQIYHICDAVIGMEGNGPSAGSPRKIGCLLASENPFALDLAASRIIGLEGEVPMITEAQGRGLCASHSDALTVLGHGLSPFLIPDFRRPEAASLSFLANIPTFLQPRPIIGPDCIGCGLCYRSCPVKAISMVEAKKDAKAKKQALIDRQKCIRCYCCQELCPYEAVDIRKHPVYKLLALVNGKRR